MHFIRNLIISFLELSYLLSDLSKSSLQISLNFLLLLNYYRFSMIFRYISILKYLISFLSQHFLEIHSNKPFLFVVILNLLSIVMKLGLFHLSCQLYEPLLHFFVLFDLFAFTFLLGAFIFIETCLCLDAVSFEFIVSMLK
jgi:hypothetical protein